MESIHNALPYWKQTAECLEEIRCRAAEGNLSGQTSAYVWTIINKTSWTSIRAAQTTLKQSSFQNTTKISKQNHSESLTARNNNELRQNVIMYTFERKNRQSRVIYICTLYAYFSLLYTIYRRKWTMILYLFMQIRCMLYKLQ